MPTPTDANLERAKAATGQPECYCPEPGKPPRCELCAVADAIDEAVESRESELEDATIRLVERRVAEAVAAEREARAAGPRWRAAWPPSRAGVCDPLPPQACELLGNE